MCRHDDKPIFCFLNKRPLSNCLLLLAHITLVHNFHLTSLSFHLLTPQNLTLFLPESDPSLPPPLKMSQEQPRRPESQQEAAVYGNSTGEIQVCGEVGHYSPPAPLAPPSTFEQSGRITIGEALEATALTAGRKTVDMSDAAAIQAAEVRATGRTIITPGGLAAAAQSAATLNARTARDEEKTKLADILADATSKLPMDKPATRKDAEGVISAELRNNPNLVTHPGGVAASVAAAARLNQNQKN
ncbi:late embryogenesis abundant protein 47 [Malania oleifera]|uniref:late embryogenesis abundant protein 47 n=1 Tax=Malania oleifera TaxID=397392 RepID=UPI0025ADC88D|nr:late embryogenesis abundant protein 47 [Malania oleifera]